MLVPSKRFDPEWMDRPNNRQADLEGALRDLRIVNRLLGGRRVVLQALVPFLDELPPDQTLRVLDVGTGGADLPIAMVRHARRRSSNIEVTALDRDPITVRIAKRETAGFPEIHVVQSDALAPPFGTGAFDVVTASLFLHHFDDRRAVDLLRRLRRLARRAVLVNDLRRHLLPWSFVHLASRATRRHPMFVHDGPLSVLRAFTPEELLTLARRAGAPGASVARRWPYRLLLTLGGEGADA